MKMTVKGVKIYSTLDVDWAAVQDIQSRLPGKDDITGVSISKDKVFRTFCSCGHTSSAYTNQCPVCGGKIWQTESGWYSNNNRIYAGVEETSDFVRILLVTYFVDTSYYDMKFNINIEHALVYDKTTKQVLSVKDTRGWTSLASDDVAKLGKFFSNITVYCNDSGNVGKIAQTCALINKYPEIFNAQKDATKTFIFNYFTRLLGKLDFDKMPVAKSDSEALMQMNFPEKLIPVSDICLNSFNSYHRIDEFASMNIDSFLDTVIGKMAEARVRHGSMNLNQLLTFVSYYKEREKSWSDEERSLFVSFCKENWDVYSPENLFHIFENRIKTLQEYGIFVSEDSLRNRNYNEAYQVRNFRKTLKNTDIAKMIAEDPLALISRIR